MAQVIMVPVIRAEMAKQVKWHIFNVRVWGGVGCGWGFRFGNRGLSLGKFNIHF